MLDVLVMTIQNMEAIQQDLLDAILINLLEPRKVRQILFKGPFKARKQIKSLLDSRKEPQKSLCIQKL